MGESGIERAADFAFFFRNTDEAREWCILKDSGRAPGCFVIAWEQCRRLVQEDQQVVVDNIFQLERQCARRVAPKRMHKLARAKSAPLERAAMETQASGDRQPYWFRATAFQRGVPQADGVSDKS